MQRYILICMIFVGVGCISACSQIEPFVDSRREAGQVQRIGFSSEDRIAVCYNPLTADMNTVYQLAEEACQKTNRRAVLGHQTSFQCRLLTPSINFYDCQ